MSSIERRIEALEEAAPIQRLPDFSGLSSAEREEIHEALEALKDGRMTPAEGQAWIDQHNFWGR